jgi:hypothetical protein
MLLFGMPYDRLSHHMSDTRVFSNPRRAATFAAPPSRRSIALRRSALLADAEAAP